MQNITSPNTNSLGKRINPLKPYQEVAQSMEAEFIKYLLQEMDKTVVKEEDDSGEVGFYKSLMNDEYASLMATKDGGLGLQKMIMNDILPENLKAYYQSGQKKPNATNPNNPTASIQKYQQQVLPK